MKSTIDRRTFIGGVSTAAVGLTIVPSSVLGGKNIAPSDKISMAYIGCGTQGLRELPDLIKNPGVQIVAVCDPQKEAVGYYDWSPKGLLNTLQNCIDDKNWYPGGDGRIPGGLNNGKDIVESYYSRVAKNGNYKGCAAYTDFREMFETNKNIDAVKIMATDHLHGVMATAAIKRGIHITMHKPIANRLEEGFKVIEMAKKSDVTTHLIPWESNGSMEQVLAWIKGGVIGELKEVHNWSNRPVWPQYAEMPAEQPKLPNGFDWDLWLGPEASRPYHPNYTNMVFRGWYDFGGGAMADMGHYSLWTVFRGLGLENPYFIEPQRSHVCGLTDKATAYRLNNDYAFPFASSCRFKYPKNSWRPAIDLIWYDGGIRPPVPEALLQQDKDLPQEGLMFVGSKGIIMSPFMLKDPYVVSGDLKLADELNKNVSYERASGVQRFVDAVKAGSQTDGSFREAWPITEAVNLYSAALRSGKNLKYDSVKRQVTNNSEVNKYLTREYRAGWGLDEV
jgi:hypothetical protein